jgi:hypothetical protein
LVDIYGRFSGTIYRVEDPSTLKTEAAGSFETLYLENVENSFVVNSGVPSRR